jgi:ABC-type xylose transport system permease subunit
MKKGEYVDMNFFDLLNEMGIGWRYLLNGLIGAVVWSIYKKLRLIEALRQILIGSIVAGYITPLIAYKEAIPIEYMAALSFIIGMMGMIIIDGIYKYIAGKIKTFRKGKEKEKLELENSEF